MEGELGWDCLCPVWPTVKTIVFAILFKVNPSRWIAPQFSQEFTDNIFTTEIADFPALGQVITVGIANNDCGMTVWFIR